MVYVIAFYSYQLSIAELSIRLWYDVIGYGRKNKWQTCSWLHINYRILIIKWSDVIKILDSRKFAEIMIWSYKVFIWKKINRIIESTIVSSAIVSESFEDPARKSSSFLKHSIKVTENSYKILLEQTFVSNTWVANMDDLDLDDELLKLAGIDNNDMKEGDE